MPLTASDFQQLWC